MEIEWTHTTDSLPRTEEQETGVGSRYFSHPLYVKRGSRVWAAQYKPSTGQWYSISGIDITKYVKFWKRK